MTVWKITKIPTINVINMQERAVQSVQLFMKSILHLMGGVQEFKTNCFEIVYLHRERSKVEIYILVHGNVNNNIYNVLEQQLISNNYQFEKLNSNDIEQLNDMLIRCAYSEMHAVIKTEKIVTTPYIYEGYY